MYGVCDVLGVPCNAPANLSSSWRISLTTRQSSWSVGISGRMVIKMSNNAPKHVLSFWSLTWNSAWARAVASCLSWGAHLSLWPWPARSHRLPQRQLIHSLALPPFSGSCPLMGFVQIQQLASSRNFQHSSSRVPRYTLVLICHSFPKSLFLPSQRPPPYTFISCRL